MKRRKRSFTLLECILSLGLLTLLLSSLFFWYGHLSTIRQKSEEERWPLLEERYVYQQLKRILPEARPEPYFFTSLSGKGLVFTFDHEMHPHPSLSGRVLGHLYLDEENHLLCLGIWPLDATEPSETRILLDAVTDLEFSFYYPPDPTRLLVNPDVVGSPSPIIGLQKTWLHAYHCLPPLLQLTIQRGCEHMIEYAFDLPYSAASSIKYLKEGAA